MSPQVPSSDSISTLNTRVSSIHLGTLVYPRCSRSLLCILVFRFQLGPRVDV